MARRLCVGASCRAEREGSGQYRPCCFASRRGSSRVHARFALPTSLCRTRSGRRTSTRRSLWSNANCPAAESTASRVSRERSGYGARRTPSPTATFGAANLVAEEADERSVKWPRLPSSAEARRGEPLQDARVAVDDAARIRMRGRDHRCGCERRREQHRLGLRGVSTRVGRSGGRNRFLCERLVRGPV